VAEKGTAADSLRRNEFPCERTRIYARLGDWPRRSGISSVFRFSTPHPAPADPPSRSAALAPADEATQFAIRLRELASPAHFTRAELRDSVPRVSLFSRDELYLSLSLSLSLLLFLSSYLRSSVVQRRARPQFGNRLFCSNVGARTPTRIRKKILYATRNLSYSRLSTPDSRLPTPDSRLPTPNSQLSTPTHHVRALTLQNAIPPLRFAMRQLARSFFSALSKTRPLSLSLALPSTRNNYLRSSYYRFYAILHCFSKFQLLH
jgi:hypothetical protein